MRRNLIVAVVCIVLAAGLAGCAGVPAPPAEKPVPVTVIVTPPLTWPDVTAGDMPALRSLAEDSAVALVVSKRPGDSRETLTSVAGVTVVEASGTPAQIDARIAEAVAAAPVGSAVVVASALGEARAGRGAPAGVVVVSAPGHTPGVLESLSTRRPGLVTDGDVAATVARIEGAGEATAGLAASVVTDGRTPAERMDRLQRMAIFLTAAEKIRFPVFNVYTAAMTVLLLGAWFFAERGRAAARFAYWSLVLRRLIVLGLVLPVGATLLHVANRFPESPERIVGLLLAASGFLWVFAEFAWHRWGTAGALAFCGIAAAGVLGIDQLTGASLTLSSIFSYSPLAGYRFFGIGNEGASILVGGALIGLALELDATTPAPVRRRLLIAATGVAAVLLCAAPFFGANVVVSLWGTVTFAAFGVAAEQRRVRIRDIVATVALSVAAVAAMVLFDRFTGGTHIGRAVAEASGGGLAGLVSARIATSVRIFTDSALPALMLAVTAVVAYVRVRPRGRAAAVFSRYPCFAAAFTAGLVGGVVGSLAEDSGVVIIALVLTYLMGALVALMLVPEKTEVPE